MFPLKLLEEPKDKTTPVQYPPADETCFIVAKNGIFKQISNPLYSIRVKSQTILAGLAEATESKTLKVDKLPFKLFSTVEAFFTTINETLHGEAIVVLSWNPVTRQWCVKIPAQETTRGGLSVRYDMRKGRVVVAYLEAGLLQWTEYTAESKLPPALADYIDFGTIHSHCEISAFHSGTDDKDEVHFDGLHITVGRVHLTVKEYAVRWILCGNSFTVSDIGTVVDFPPGYQADAACISQVKPREIPVDQVQGGFPGSCVYELDTGGEERMRSLGDLYRKKCVNGRRLLNPGPEDFDLMDEDSWNKARRRQSAPSTAPTEGEIKASMAQGGVWSHEEEKVIMPGERGYLLTRLQGQAYHTLTDDELALAEAAEENEDLWEVLQDNVAYLEVLANRDVLEAYLHGDMNALAGIQFEIDRRKSSKKAVKKSESEKGGGTVAAKVPCPRPATAMAQSRKKEKEAVCSTESKK